MKNFMRLTILLATLFCIESKAQNQPTLKAVFSLNKLNKFTNARNDNTLLYDTLLLKKEMEYLDSIKKALKYEIEKSPYSLVSNYTFRHIIKNDFVNLIGESRVPGQYASMSITKSNQQLSFSPYTKMSNPVRTNFHNIFSINIKASVSDKGILSFKNLSTINMGFNYTYVDGIYRGQTKTDTSLNNSIYSEVQKKISSIIGLKKITEILDNDANYKRENENSPYSIDKNSLGIAYLNKVKDYEIKLAKNLWSRKKMQWFNVNADIISNTKFNYIDINDATTKNSPKTKSYWSPSIQASYNWYYLYKSGFSYYLSIKGSLNRKHSITDILSSSKWNQFTGKINDSTYEQINTKDVYIVDAQKFNTLLIADYGFQAIGFKDWEIFTIGIDFSYDNKGFIIPQTTNTIGRQQNFLLGIILPMKDKDGKSTVLIEPFHQYSQFTNYNKSSENFWGVKFSIPFNL